MAQSGHAHGALDQHHHHHVLGDAEIAPPHLLEPVSGLHIPGSVRGSGTPGKLLPLPLGGGAEAAPGSGLPVRELGRGAGSGSGK